MNNQNKIDRIDEVLAQCEDILHGRAGEEVTEARKLLSQLATIGGSADVSFSSRDILKDIINQCQYIFDYATVPRDGDISNPQIAGSLVMSYQRYLKAQEIVSDES